ncbi:hypothetical protein QZH41_018286, partial [Actinostola sp. cb2023]
AVVRYYETKRKIFLQSLPQNKEKTTKAMLDNKIRSRRKRLYGARVKVAQGSDLDAVNSQGTYISLWQAQGVLLLQTVQGHAQGVLLLQTVQGHAQGVLLLQTFQGK